LGVYVFLIYFLGLFRLKFVLQVLPTGFMQFPFFHSELPDVVQFAFTGRTLGHEIAHAFDGNNQKVVYKDGSKNWFTPFSMNAYKEKAQCFVEQYQKFTFLDWRKATLAVNGKVSVEENIVDSVGMKLSYHAWKLSTLQDQNVLLQGLETLTPEQMFFVAFGHAQCSTELPSNAEENNLSKHAPRFARVNGVLQNSMEFRRAFQCPENTYMAPAKRCEMY
jgi:endothelin-converting enzyme